MKNSIQLFIPLLLLTFSCATPKNYYMFRSGSGSAPSSGYVKKSPASDQFQDTRSEIYKSIEVEDIMEVAPSPVMLTDAKPESNKDRDGLKPNMKKPAFKESLHENLHENNHKNHRSLLRIQDKVGENPVNKDILKSRFMNKLVKHVPFNRAIKKAIQEQDENEPDPGKNWAAGLGLFMAFLFPPLGIVLSIVGLKSEKRELATFGLVLSTLFTVIILSAIIALMSIGPIVWWG